MLSDTVYADLDARRAPHKSFRIVVERLIIEKCSYAASITQWAPSDSKGGFWNKIKNNLCDISGVFAELVIAFRLALALAASCSLVRNRKASSLTSISSRLSSLPIVTRLEEPKHDLLSPVPRQ